MKTKKCIVCEKEINDGLEIKKYQANFCGLACVQKYEKLLEDTKNNMKIGDCC